MLLDLEKIDHTKIIEADICIVGAGVAGQTLAASLKDSKLKIVLLESGDKDFRRDVEELSDGDNVGLEYYDLKTSHLRLFGGTAAIWGGRCAELDDIDFQRRDFLAHSGWPIDKSDLTSFYRQIFDQLELEKPTGLWDKLGRRRPAFDSTKIDTGLWVFDEKGERFADTQQSSLQHCDIVLNATVTEIEKSETGEITSISAKSLKDTSIKVKAKAFVLAAGAIETARILLAAGDGLGNRYDQVGRYFMEHPHARGGEIITDKPARALSLLPRAIRHRGKRYAAYLRDFKLVIEYNVAPPRGREDGELSQRNRQVKT